MSTITSTSNSKLYETLTITMEIAPDLEKSKQEQIKADRKKKKIVESFGDVVVDGKIVIVLDFEDVYGIDRTHKYNIGIISEDQMKQNDSSKVRIDMYTYVSSVSIFVRRGEVDKIESGDIYDISNVIQTECRPQDVKVKSILEIYTSLPKVLQMQLQK